MNTVSYVGFEVGYVIVDDNLRFYRCIKLAVKGSQKGCAGYYFNCIPVIRYRLMGSDSNLLLVFYVQIMPDDLVMQLHRF